MKSATSSPAFNLEPAVFATTGLLSLLLVFPLFSILSFGFITGQPWKMEFLSSLLASAFLGTLFIIRRQSIFDLFNVQRDKHLAISASFLVLFFIWSAVSSSWSASPASSAHHTLNWSLYLICALVVSNLKNSLGPSLAAFVILAAIVGICAITDHLTATDFASVEGSIRIRYAKFVEMLVTFLPLVWMAATVTRKSRNARLLLIGGALGWVAVMLSLSRGAFLAGIVAFLFTFAAAIVFSPRFRRPTFRLAGLWLALTIVVQLIFTFGANTASTAQYISGSADPSQSTAHMRLFTWKIAIEMIEDHGLLGVGADNFGLRFNESRAQYAVKHPEDADLAIAEDYLVERAHNEPLQILAELGVIGFAFFVCGFGTFAFWAGKVLMRRRNVSPLLVACLGGMFGFAISSLFSSFSFRAVQNGLVFSIIFGIAIRYLQKYSTVKPTAGNALVSPRILAMTSLVLTLLMVLAAGRMGISRVYQRSAEHTADINVRMRLLERSLAWDNENAASYSEYSAAKASLGAFDDAAASLRSCIDNGAASTEIYSSLAELYSYAGDRTAARSTIAEAVSIYPRSVFARVRYAQIAEQNGDNDVAGQELAKARELDRKQANGWVVLLRDGDLAAFNEARGSNDVAEPSELLPAGAVLRYIDKTSFVASSK